MHGDDPEAIPLSSAEAVEYDRRAVELGRAAPPPTMELSYGADRAQLIDVYCSAERSSPRPILLFFHGGAWIAGHLGWLRFMGPAAAANGFLFVGAGYRLAPRCRWPAQLDDARAALEHVQANARQWGGDPDRLVVGGHSAGGQLASLLALADRPAIVGCMPVSSPFDLRYGDVDIESQAGRIYKYLLADRSQDAEASPLRYAANAHCPFHVSWGERDLERVRDSSERMVDALRAGGARVSFEVRARANHFDTHLALGDAADPWYDRLTHFVAPAGRVHC